MIMQLRNGDPFSNRFLFIIYILRGGGEYPRAIPDAAMPFLDYWWRGRGDNMIMQQKIEILSLIVFVL